jgi:hypothetical protein
VRGLDFEGIRPQKFSARGISGRVFGAAGDGMAIGKAGSILRGGAIGLAGLLALVVLAALMPRPAAGQAAGGNGPAVCRIGVNVEALYDLDMPRDTFGAILWVWSICPSADLRPLDGMVFPTAAGSLNLAPVETLDVEAGDVYASRRVQGTFRYNWEMNAYPFDRQPVVIPMDEAVLGADRLVFEPDVKESFLSPEIRDQLDEWSVSDLTVTTSVSEEASSYGVPGAEGARYARVDVAFTLERTQIVTFLKLTSGVFAAAFIAFISFFYDPNDKGTFSGKLGLLIGVLFAVLVNLRTADSSIGDTGHLTLVTKIHLVTLALIVILALFALWDRRRVDGGAQIRHPDWPKLALIGGAYVLVMTVLILRAAWS